MEHSHAALTRQMRETARLVSSQQVRDLLFTGASVLDRLAGELATAQGAQALVAADAQQAVELAAALVDAMNDTLLLPAHRPLAEHNARFHLRQALIGLDPRYADDPGQRVAPL